MNYMAKVYTSLIQKGLKTLEEVPLELKEAVELELQKLKEVV